MKNAIRLLAALQLVACTTSSLPSSGFDGGPSFDVPGLDSSPADSFSAPDTRPVPFDAGRPFQPDASPPPDVGPRDAAVIDSGPPDAEPIACMPEGSYAATPFADNPSICDMAGVTSCSVAASGTPGSLSLRCAGVSAECVLLPNCTCSGITMFAGIPIDVRVNFAVGIATFSAVGMACDYTLTMR